jgi:hypothetical protein
MFCSESSKIGQKNIRFTEDCTARGRRRRRRSDK